MSSTVKSVINFWAILCFFHTILYGGEVFSSIAVLSPPVHPESLMDLCLTKPQVLSQSTYMQPAIGTFSKIAYDLHSLVSVITKVANAETPEIDCMKNIVEEINHNWCDCPDQINVLSGVDNPQVCRQQHGNPSYDQPVVFIEETATAMRLKFIYERSPHLWWTSVKTLRELQHMEPVLCIANYFAKLLDPVLNSWISFGLMDHIMEFHSFLEGSRFKQMNSLNSTTENNNSFKPMEVKVLFAIINIFYVLISVSAIILGVEMNIFSVVDTTIILGLGHIIQKCKQV